MVPPIVAIGLPFVALRFLPLRQRRLLVLRSGLVRHGAAGIVAVGVVVRPGAVAALPATTTATPFRGHGRVHIHKCAPTGWTLYPNAHEAIAMPCPGNQ